MPKTATPFSPNKKQLSRGIEHVCYEYANLMSAAYWDMRGQAPWRTHADDAFLLGYRKIGDFLLNKHRSKMFGQEMPDILALDYLSTGQPVTWTLPTWNAEWREAMNKQLAHLSYERDKSWVHYKWIPKLEAEFRTAWQEFRKAVHPNYRRRFAYQIAKCRM